MADEHEGMNDVRLELMVSTLLRSGVLIAAAVVIAGGAYFLARHGTEPVNVSHFGALPPEDTQTPDILKGAFNLRARSIIQLGIVLLILTPVARVGLCLLGFAAERDRKYIVITLIVLAVLLYSLISGAAGLA